MTPSEDILEIYSTPSEYILETYWSSLRVYFRNIFNYLRLLRVYPRNMLSIFQKYTQLSLKMMFLAFFFKLFTQGHSQLIIPFQVELGKASDYKGLIVQKFSSL